MLKNRVFICIACICALIVSFLFLPESIHCKEAGWVKAPVPAEKLQTFPEKKKKADNQDSSTPLAQKNAAKKGKTVYDSQPDVTEKELMIFLALLPEFRNWAKQNNEDAHPVLSKDGNPDFFFSGKTAKWIKDHNINPARFFCIMGKMAAALVIVEEGNDFKGTRPKDMPAVSQKELDLARNHLGELLSASNSQQTITINK